MRKRYLQIKMKVVGQSTLSVGVGGKILVDATNIINNETGKFKDSKSAKGNGKNIENRKPGKEFSLRKDRIYVDNPVSIITQAFADKEVQTEELVLNEDTSVQHIEDSVQQTIALLTNEKPPYEYWVRLAEKRRVALDISIEENESLKEENEMLKEENKVMEEMLEEAKGLALVVKNLTEFQELSESHNEGCEARSSCYKNQ